MSGTNGDLPAPSWQVTATRAYCDTVSGHVTVMVQRDWTPTCGWQGRNGNRGTRCSVGPECPVIVEFRARLTREETLAAVR